MEITYKGGIYAGDLREGIPHGHGTFDCTDYHYEGRFQHGRFHGWGELHATESWSGEEETYLYNSRGERLFWGGIDYEGEFMDGIPNGKGTMYDSDDFACYEGQLLDAVPHGNGRAMFYDGRIFDGCWANGKADGAGRYLLTDGKVYEGNWNANILYVEDGFVSITGDVYRGGMLDGVPHGPGTLTISVNRERYDGGFLHGKYSGYGKYICYRYDNTVDYTYEGYFKDGRYHGEGKFTHLWFQWSYEGSYMAGHQDGSGQLIYPDGRTLTGWLLLDCWKFNKMITRGQIEELFVTQLL